MLWQWNGKVFLNHFWSIQNKRNRTIRFIIDGMFKCRFSRCQLWSSLFLYLICDSSLIFDHRTNHTYETASSSDDQMIRNTSSKSSTVWHLEREYFEKSLQIYIQLTPVYYEYKIVILLVEQKGLSAHKNILLLECRKNKIDKKYNDGITEEIC